MISSDPNGGLNPTPPMPYNGNVYVDAQPSPGPNTVELHSSTINGGILSNVSAATINIVTNSEVDPYVGGVSGIPYHSILFFYNTINRVPGSSQYYAPGSHTTTITPNSLISGGATNTAIGTKLYILYYSELQYTTSLGVNYSLPSSYNPGVGSSTNPGGLQIGYIITVEPCSKPTNLTQTSYQSNQIPLSWSAPSDTGGGTLGNPTSYIVQYNTTGYSPWIQIDTQSSSTNYTVSGLINGTVYYFQVAAVNGYCNNGGPASGPFSTTFSSISSTTPDAPTNLVATPGLQNVSLTWDVPFNNGGTSITAYTVQYRISGTPTWTTASSSISGTTPYYVVSSLTDGTTYDFQVSATNTAGTGPYSAVASATTFAVPDAPTHLVAQSGIKSISLTWDIPFNDGGTPITSYVVQYRLFGMTPPSPWVPTSPIPVAGNTPYYVVSGLLDETKYEFEVAAINAVGTGPYSGIATASTYGVPSAPINLAAQSGLQSVSLTWDPPLYNGGLPITSYLIEYRVNGTSSWNSPPISIAASPSYSPSYVVSGLQDGTLYDFRVAAVNAVGPGPYSNIVTAKTYGFPTPVELTAEPGFQSVSLTWTTPSDDGGTPITSYIVQYRVNGTSTWNVATTVPAIVLPSTATIHCIVVGLLNGTLYDFRVAPVNAFGTGPYSYITCSTDTVPSAPINLSGVPGILQVSLTWTAPTNDGGSPITDYLIEYKLNSSSTWTIFPHAQSIATNATVAGLNGNSLYDFRVSAKNIVGYSVPSNVFETTPFDANEIQYNKCGIKGYVSPPPPWSRAGGNNCPNCVSNYGYAGCAADNGLVYSTYALDQRRKAEILKYRSNRTQLSPAMFYSMISRNEFTRKKSWATQTQTYTNPNVNNLPGIQNAAGITVALQCNQPPVRCSLTSDSDVPGPVIPLCIDESVPLYNYKMQVTPASGGNFEPFEEPFEEP